MQQKELLRKLEALGLKEKESRVYIALLARGQVGTSVLVRATRLHGQFVYSALDRLEELGLAKHVVEKGRKRFSANSPARLLAIWEEKREFAAAATEELEALFTIRPPQAFETTQGIEAFVAKEMGLLKELKEGCELVIIGGSGKKYIENMGFMMDSFEKERIKRGIKIRYISPAGQEAYLKIMAQNRRLFEFRVLPNLSEGTIDTAIWPNKVSYSIFGTPLLTFTLSSPEAAEGQRQYFEVLWHLSR